MSNLKFIKYRIRRGVLSDGSVVTTTVQGLETNISGDFYPLPYMLHALRRTDTVPENRGLPYVLPFAVE